MKRRDFVKRLSAGLALGPLVIKLQACAGDTEVPTRPSGGGGGGADAGGTIAQFRVTNTDSSGHGHWFWIACSEAAAGVETRYTAEGTHSHLVTVSAADLDRILAGEQVTLSTTDGHPHTWIIQMPSGMCSGDPGGDPPDEEPPDDGGGGGGGGW